MLIPKQEVIERQDLMKSFLKIHLTLWCFNTEPFHASEPPSQQDQLLLSTEKCFLRPDWGPVSGWPQKDQSHSSCSKSKIDFQTQSQVILSWWFGMGPGAYILIKQPRKYRGPVRLGTHRTGEPGCLPRLSDMSEKQGSWRPGRRLPTQCYNLRSRNFCSFF